MFSRKTVFVVGAGASAEVGLPVGDKLAGAISKLFRFRFEMLRLVQGDGDFLAAMQRQFPERDALQAHFEAGERISDGVSLVSSIDNYIDAHRHDARIAACGKTAIVYSILRAERDSSLHIDTSSRADARMDFGRTAKSWFNQFSSMLAEGISVDTLDRIFENVSFICFNYDRCIEHYLANWLAAVYGLEARESQRLVSKLRILRPYGLVGPIHDPDENRNIPFGANPAHKNVWSLREGIKTYTEQIEDGVLLDAIANEFATAEVIVLLGFAFHRQNMKLLIRSMPIKAKRIVASAFEVSPANVESIRAELRNAGGESRKVTKGPPFIDIQQSVCWEVMRDYRRNILAHDLG